MKTLKHAIQIADKDWNRFVAWTILEGKLVCDGITEILKRFIEDPDYRGKILAAPESPLRRRQGAPAHFVRVDISYDAAIKFDLQEVAPFPIAEVVRRCLALDLDRKFPGLAKKLPAEAIVDGAGTRTISINHIDEDSYAEFRAACAFHGQTVGVTINGTLKNLDRFEGDLKWANTGIYVYAKKGAKIPEDQREAMINTRVTVDDEAYRAGKAYAEREGIPLAEVIRRVINLASMPS